MSKKCIECGAILEDDALFCDECGKQQSEKTYGDLLIEEEAERKREEEERKQKEEEAEREKIIAQIKKEQEEKRERFPDLVKNTIVSTIIGLIISYLLGFICFYAVITDLSINYMFLLYVALAWIVGGGFKKRFLWKEPIHYVIAALVTAFGIFYPFVYGISTGELLVSGYTPGEIDTFSMVIVIFRIFTNNWLRIVSVVLSIIVSLVRTAD